MRASRLGQRLGMGAILMLLACVGRGEVRVTAQGSPVQVRPADEAREDGSFATYRADLIRAISKRDAHAVLAFMAPDLARVWRSWLLTPRESFSGGEQSTWDHLAQLLALGGTFTTTRGAVKGRREFCAPYVYSTFPWPVPSGYGDSWVVLEADVPVHQGPDGSAPVLARLSHELVRAGGAVGPLPHGPFWVSVELPDGREGYVRDAQIRSPTDYHACFAQIEGRWQMVRFARDITPTGPPK